MSVTQILVVDDFLPWLRFIQEIFHPETDFAIVATANDGLEAVQKASELWPDVILMDVGLRKMNGLEATRQIRVLCPECKILFLSGDNSPELIAAAFEAGGSGYVWKPDANLDLTAGIRTILRDQPFVSRSLHKWRDVAD